MEYISTRDKKASFSAANAIMQGISKEGGLFVPRNLPKLEFDDIEGLSEKTYIERAVEILSLFLTDFSDEQLVSCVKSAYENRFDSEDITEISHLFDGRYILELWHGPTCAFKDMALQLLPRLMTESAEIIDDKEEIVVLVATSGDTGKAALEGFKDVKNTKIIVFYPVDGVSSMQKRQMITQEGKNVTVCAINGNFDDAQSAVKSIFTDEALAKELKAANMHFSSANSINWGRLVPQIVYYISCYADLVANEEINLGDEINVCVPTGNFGNILAAYYAKKMGVPIGKLICASNRNNVLADFINTGIYDKNRDFYPTISPSMDILISSNLERLIFDLYENDDEKIKALYKELNEDGRFEVICDVKDRLLQEFYGGWCSDDEIEETIKAVFERYSYLLDTHTAVAVKVYEDYREKTGDDRKVIIASTANPYKFSSSVYEAVSGGRLTDEYEQIAELEKISGMTPPNALSELKHKEVRFSKVIERNEIKGTVKSILKI